jgi:hypothetical protein
VTLTTERLREVLNYNSETGVFTNIFNRRRAKAGDIAGQRHGEGYWVISIDNKKHLAHRLAWLYAHGEWPEYIDHIDHNRMNNRLSNLRSVSMSVNQQNVVCAKANNISCGFLGVYFCRQTLKWGTQIRVCGKRKHLGKFDTPELAHAAYIAAKRQFHQGNTL